MSEGFGLPPVRYSFLKLMAKSPAHYKQAVDDDIKEQIGRYTQERGSALHSLVLGGPPVIKYDGKQRRGQYWEEFQEKHPKNAHILTAKEFEKTHAMALRIHACSAAKPILKGAHEKEINWNWLNRDCQSHIDILGANHIAEVKTCESSDPERFRWMALKYGYHAQLAFYRMAYGYDVTGYTDGRSNIPCFIIAVESKAPYPVSVIRVSEDLISKGELMCRAWMERMLVCEESGQWPAYSESVTQMEAPEEDPELQFPDEVAQDE